MFEPKQVFRCLSADDAFLKPTPTAWQVNDHLWAESSAEYRYCFGLGLTLPVSVFPFIYLLALLSSVAFPAPS